MTRVTVGSLRPSVQTSNRGTASEASQAQVNTGTADGVYVSPKTLAEKVEVITASGTDTYTATIPGTLTSGRRVYIKFTNANTGASTLNGTAIKKSVNTALSSGDIAAGEIKLLAYDGTNFQVVGGSGSGSATPSINVEGGAERKISAMTALTAANAATGDLFTVVDVSDTTDAASGTNKKMTVTEATNVFSDPQHFFRTGNYHHPGVIAPGSADGNHALTANQLRAWPFWITKTITITNIDFNCVGAVALSKTRLGIYTDNGNCYPDQLVAGSDAAEYDTATPGVKSSGAVSITLKPGLYWMSTLSNGAISVRSVPNYISVLGSSVSYASTGGRENSHWNVSQTYGSMPSTFTAGGSMADSAGAVLKFSFLL